MIAYETLELETVFHSIQSAVFIQAMWITQGCMYMYIDHTHYNWGERERALTLLMSTSDRHTAHARTLLEFC